MTVLTDRADASLMEMAERDITSFCFIRDSEVESPGLMGYSTSRLCDRGRYPPHRSMNREQRGPQRGRKTFTALKRTHVVGSNRQIEYHRMRGD